MSTAHKRKIALGVSGSIAAFKAASLASDLVKTGHEVRVILTSGAARFVTPLTFAALTGHDCAVDLWTAETNNGRIGHIELAKWADILVVAPASASTIARLAHGLPDDMLGAVALATSAPLVLAPAMETEMYAHAATQANIRLLLERGARTVGPENGRLASGAVGRGRMAEPPAIQRVIEEILSRSRDFSGKRVLVTAGPTYEAIDRVRFLGNRSSGKMGYAIAQVAASRGAEVLLVSGPTALEPPRGVEFVPVESAAEMLAAVLNSASECNAVIMAAAVADYVPTTVASGKIRRTDGLTLELTATADIASAAVNAAPEAVHVGFALEAEDVVEPARRKLERKGQHLVVANLISDAHNPFGADENQVTFVTEESVCELPVMSKIEVAERLLDEVLQLMP